LKIHHALKETSYPTDLHSMTGFATIATTIGNYLLEAGPRTPPPSANDIAAIIYIGRPGEQDDFPFGETTMPQAS
jgi:hypothetical protein